MLSDPFLQQLFASSTRKQTRTFRGLGVAALALVLIGVPLLVAAPPESDKELSYGVGGALSALLLFGGFASWRRADQLVQDLQHILGNPQEINNMKLFKLYQRGAVVWAVQLTNRAGKKVKMIVPSEVDGKKAIEHIRNLPRAGA